MVITSTSTSQRPTRKWTELNGIEVNQMVARLSAKLLKCIFSLDIVRSISCYGIYFNPIKIKVIITSLDIHWHAVLFGLPVTKHHAVCQRTADKVNLIVDRLCALAVYWYLLDFTWFDHILLLVWPTRPTVYKLTLKSIVYHVAQTVFLKRALRWFIVHMPVSMETTRIFYPLYFWWNSFLWCLEPLKQVTKS